MSMDCQELRNQLRLTQAVFAIAQAFVGPQEHDQIIEGALRSLGQVSGAGRSYLFLFNDGEGTMSNTHEWCDDGVVPEIGNLKDLPVDLFPWWMEQLRRGEVIHIEDVDAIGEEGRAERDILQSQGIRSVLVLPVQGRDSLFGFVGLDNVASTGKWTAEQERILRVAGEMIALTLMRRETERRILQQKKQLEEAYRELTIRQTQLIQSEKLAGIGQLAAGIAHEINNPIGYVTSNTRTMKRYVDSLLRILGLYHSGVEPERIRAQEQDLQIDFVVQDLQDLLEENLGGLERVAEIVRNLKDFARTDQVEGHALAQINGGLERSLMMVANELKYRASVERDLGDVPPVICNLGELNQVFVNILVNAAQAIEERGGEESGVIRVRTFLDGEWVVCRIEDNGGGMTPEIRDKIFEPFFTTKPVGKGTGLGLNISYDIVVNRHRGTIEVESEVGRGTAFILRLPLAGVEG